MNKIITFFCCCFSFAWELPEYTFFTANQILGCNNMLPKRPHGVVMLLMLMVFDVSGTPVHHISLQYVDMVLGWVVQKIILLTVEVELWWCKNHTMFYIDVQKHYFPYCSTSFWFPWLCGKLVSQGHYKMLFWTKKIGSKM